MHYQPLGMGTPFKMSNYNDQIERDTKWWNDYPPGKYSDFARPAQTYQNYIGECWEKPKELMRSASYTNLTYVKEAEHDMPIRRVPSVSSLSPSHVMPYHYRVPERFVSTARVYRPESYDWYHKSYQPYKQADTFDYIRRPLVKVHPSFEYSSHVPYYVMQTKRLFFNKKMENNRSYLDGSRGYLDKYVSARLKADDFAQRFVHSAYESRRPSDYRFNRNFMLGSQVCVPIATGNPTNYHNAQALRKLYKMTEKFYF